MTRWILALVVASLVSAAAAASADAPTRIVSMPAKLYDPDRLDVLVGTTVTWRNDDSVNHTATAENDAFASGYIAPGGSFSYAFTRQGRYEFRCTIHRQMRGEVNVFGLVLAGPEAPVTVGRRIVLAGLAPAGTQSVSLRGTRPELSVRPRADGSFALRVTVTGPGGYRAVAGTLTSPRLRVFAKPIVRATQRGRVLHVTTTPARPGVAVALQEYDRERFGWHTIRRGVLDRRSRARFDIPTGVERARAVVRGQRGWADAASPGVIVASGRVANAGSEGSGDHTPGHSG